MMPWSGPYPRVADALVDIMANAVARYGDCTKGLQLDEPCNEKISYEQWHAFSHQGDSVAFISWCADKIRSWHTPKYMRYMIQAPLYGMPKPMDGVIMSPDGQTDWTCVAWHVRYETKSDIPFTKEFINKLEAELAESELAELAKLKKKKANKVF